MSSAHARKILSAKTSLAQLILLPLAAMAGMSAAGAVPPLSVAAQSHDAVWNAVAVERDRIFLSGPRWTGTKLPPLVILENGSEPRPFPNGAWNDWRTGMDATTAFVNINTLHLDGKGGLWAVDTGAPDFGVIPCRMRPSSEPKGLLGGTDRATLLVRKNAEGLIGRPALDELSNLHLGDAKVRALDAALQRTE